MVERPIDASDELTLVERAARGDHDAFGALVRLYEPQLHAYLLQMLGDVEAARDVAQETFIAAYQALPRWRPPAAPAAPAGAHSDSAHPLSPWLYRIATNKALSSLRTRATRPSIALAHAASSEPTNSGFEERYAARELLRSALRRLSSDDAACLVLHYVAGERYGEIGRKLGLTSEAVRKRVSRSLTALRAAYNTLDTEVRR